MADDRALLYKVHVARLKAHGYNSAAMARVVEDFETLRKGDMYGSSL